MAEWASMFARWLLFVFACMAAIVPAPAAFAADVLVFAAASLKDALDDGNNNKNFVQAEACDVNYSGLETSCLLP